MMSLSLRCAGCVMGVGTHGQLFFFMMTRTLRNVTDTILHSQTVSTKARVCTSVR